MRRKEGGRTRSISFAIEVQVSCGWVLKECCSLVLRYSLWFFRFERDVQYVSLTDFYNYFFLSLQRPLCSTKDLLEVEFYRNILFFFCSAMIFNLRSTRMFALDSFFHLVALLLCRVCNQSLILHVSLLELYKDHTNDCLKFIKVLTLMRI